MGLPDPSDKMAQETSQKAIRLELRGDNANGLVRLSIGIKNAKLLSLENHQQSIDFKTAKR